MSYGMHISASGAQAALYRQDALTANLANINTAGFKPVLAAAAHREVARAEDGLWNLPSDELLEKLGGGVFSARTAIDFTQGPLETTDRDFDLAIQGEGFFLVENPKNEDAPFLTRDGRLTLTPDGTLVQSATGRAVLSDGGQPIVIDPSNGPIRVDGDGSIAQGETQVARLALSDVPDRSVLVKVGEGLFAHESGQSLKLTGATGVVLQHTLEGSGVNEIDAMLGITGASRSAQSNIGMLDMQNRMLDRLVNTYARIS